MIKGLTRRAQKILTTYAQEEARRFQSDKLLPEHIVIAILKSGEGSAWKILKKIGVDINEMLMEMEKSLPPRSGRFILGEAPPSQRVKNALEVAANEATVMKHEFIGTEHFLLAILQENESATAKYLSGKDIQLEQLRDLVFEQSRQLKTQEQIFANRISRPSVSKPVPVTSFLDRFAKDLTAAARSGELDPVIGRDREINQMMRILARRTKNNPVLLGEPGVGKTAIVEGLALRITHNDAPEYFSGRRVVTLDLASVIAGTKYRGEFEERIKKIIKELKKARNVIIFIDEIHTIIGAGAAEGAIDASNILKPALARGTIQCIGATTLDEFKKHFEKDAALVRRFQSVMVEEPSVEETMEILKGLKTRYEDHHNVTYTDAAIQSAADLSVRYIPEKFLPDKAIDLMDEAGSQKKIEQNQKPPAVTDLEKEVQRLTEEKIALVNVQDYEKAAAVRDKVRTIQEKILNEKDKWNSSLRNQRNKITQKDIEQVIADKTGIPLVRITKTESERLLKIEKELHRTVIGQDQAINVIASSIRRSRTGIGSPARPSGSFIFLGPTGVGKTLLARTLAEYLFGDSEALIRIDMSDYMEKHNVSRLVGAPPGYVGYEEGGLLTEKVRRRPYSIVLLDEIEKAHNDVFNMLLQILEEGELQDSLGHTVNFRNCVIIMTSNSGSEEIFRGGGIGFQSDDSDQNRENIRNLAMNHLKRKFRPEFLNRVDDIVVFHSLNEQEMMEILNLLVDDLQSRLISRAITLNVSKRVKQHFIETGSDAALGARPLRRILQREVEDPLAMGILDGQFKSGDRVSVQWKSGKVRFVVTKPAAKKKAVSGKSKN